MSGFDTKRTLRRLQLKLSHYNKKEQRLIKPKHPVASFCLREKIFEGLNSFSDLDLNEYHIQVVKNFIALPERHQKIVADVIIALTETS